MSRTAPQSRIDHLLADARRSLRRVDPTELDSYCAQGSVIVDIRPESYRILEGEIPGALAIERNVLEWRLDPTSAHRISDDLASSTHVIVVCNDGYASSLAAVALQQLGLEQATDLAGGYRAWRRLKSSSEVSPSA